MQDFHYKNGELYCEEVPLREISESRGTPVYVYSHAAIERRFRELREAFAGLDHLICYAVKANGNLSILRTLAALGAGADIVSGGELYRAVRAGFDPKSIVFAGVGKTEEEMALGMGERILLFNVESDSELEHLDRCAERYGKVARVALRVNPDVDPQSHPAIATGLAESKFGVPISDAGRLADRIRDEFHNVELLGVHQHIGSQITKTAPYVESVEKTASLVRELKDRGFDIRYFNIGGGIGIRYRGDEQPPEPKELVEAIRPSLEATQTKIICEMGRSLVGESGALLTSVLYRKNSGEKNFIIADAGMNDLLRPSLYDAYHAVRPLREDLPMTRADLVGPVCESGDYLARDRELPDGAEGEVLAVMSAGAYSFSMSSNYNSRPRAAEVMVKGESWALVREREHYQDLVKGELIPAFL